MDAVRHQPSRKKSVRGAGKGREWCCSTASDPLLTWRSVGILTYGGIQFQQCQPMGRTTWTLQTPIAKKSLDKNNKKELQELSSSTVRETVRREAMTRSLSRRHPCELKEIERVFTQNGLVREFGASVDHKAPFTRSVKQSKAICNSSEKGSRLRQ